MQIDKTHRIQIKYDISIKPKDGEAIVAQMCFEHCVKDTQNEVKASLEDALGSTINRLQKQYGSDAIITYQRVV
jgi:hypothetical protein